MADVRITKVDDETYEALRRRAAARGQSVAEYAKQVLETEAVRVQLSRNRAMT